MLSRFSKQSNEHPLSKMTLVCLSLLVISGCANITIKPKDPELMALENFANKATSHLFEINPANYEEYQKALENEVEPSVLAQLKKRGICAKSKEEIKQTIKDMDKNNKRCLIRILDTSFPSKATPEGLVPIEVQGTSVKSFNDTSKATKFDVIYLVGTNAKTKKPIIASVQIKKFD